MGFIKQHLLFPLEFTNGKPGPGRNIYRPYFQVLGISIIKIGRSSDRLIFIMKIHLLIRRRHYIERAHWSHLSHRYQTLRSWSSKICVLFVVLTYNCYLIYHLHHRHCERGKIKSIQCIDQDHFCPIDNLTRSTSRRFNTGKVYSDNWYSNSHFRFHIKQDRIHHPRSLLIKQYKKTHHKHTLLLCVWLNTIWPITDKQP